VAYLIDANVLIQAKNAHYSFSFCPAFWDWMLAANSADKLFIVPQVLAEIAKGKDQLKNWCGIHGSLKCPSHPTLSSSRSKIANWVVAQGYNANAINTFFGVADYHIVAYAEAHGHTVVTHEIASAGFAPSRVKIPDPCRAFGISCLSPFQMLENEGATFII